MGKKQVVFIHGGTAYTRYEAFLESLHTKEIRNLPWMEVPKKWSSTLADDLGAEYEVFTPAMPNSTNAKYAEWKIWFERHFEYIRDGVILVGWSLGGYFLAKYLIENDTPFHIRALFLLAAPFEPDDFDGEDGGDFTFDIEKVGEISKKAEKIIIMHSKDDFIVPYAHAEKYHQALPEAEFVIFEDKNHFLIEEFSEIVEHIQSH